MWAKRSHAWACAREERAENKADISLEYVDIGGGRDLASYSCRIASAEVGIVFGGVALRWALICLSH